MSTVFIGACSHAPGITGRAGRADPKVRDELYRYFERLRAAIEA
jgi:2,3-dihydroxyphenylpropionate 1,2-dioxygenase